MKIEKLFIIILAQFYLSLPLLSYSQGIESDSIKYHQYKNSIKAMPILAPIVPVIIFAGISTGYERYIGRHHGLELCGFINYKIDDMGNIYQNFAIMPGYKFFTKSPNERYNNFWAGVYLSYYQEYLALTDGGGSKHHDYYYGFGASVGKKINLTRNKRWFLDLGFGMTYYKQFYKPLFSDANWEDKYYRDKVIPRPILQFGWKF